MSIRMKLVGKPGDIKDEHLSSLKELDRELFPNSPPNKFNECYSFLAYDTDCVVGFCCLTPYPVNGTGFLSRVGVRKSYRGNGLQKKMIKIREKLAKKIGLSRLITYTSYDNIYSINNLISCGYKFYKPKWEFGVKYAYYVQKFI